MSKIQILICNWEVSFYCSNCQRLQNVVGIGEAEIHICPKCRAEYRVIAEPKIRKTEAQSDKELGF